MSQSPRNHPDKDLLVAFGLGQLGPDEATSVETHLELCEQCCDTLLDLKDDTFVALVRQAREPADIPASIPDAQSIRDAGREETERTEGRVDESSVEATVVLPSGPASGAADLPADLAEHPRYRIVELIGRGGMGDVYKAEHRLMNRTVALKVINRELVRNAQAVERFRREVQAAARLAHPHIVTAHDAEQAGDVHYLVMEYVAGTNLSEVVSQQGPLSISQACDYMAQAAIGLQHAHKQGMVHRDIKPHNLMVTTDGQVKILDFGLATLARDTRFEMRDTGNELASGGRQSPDGTESSEMRDAGDAIRDTSSDVSASRIPHRASRHPHPDPRHLTTAGTMMGTPDFISPEQAGDARNVDIRSDIYSLGCTLYYLLTGRPPFDEGSVMDRVKAHADNAAEPIENVRVDVPAELAEVIRRMMAKDPSERFQSPAEVADALAPFVDEHRTGDRGVGRAQALTGMTAQRPSLVGLCMIGSLSTVVFALSFGVLDSLFAGAAEWIHWWWSIGSKLSLPVGALILIFADRSERTNSHSSAMKAGWLSLLPLNPVSVLLLPVTIWTIFILRRPEIRRAYETGELPTLDDAEARRRWPMVIAIVSSILIALAGTIIYVQTDNGTLEIESIDDSVNVVLSQVTKFSEDGQQVMEATIIDTVSGSTVRALPSGTYTVKLKGDDTEFDLSTNRFVLRRGDRILVRVTRRPAGGTGVGPSVATPEAQRALNELVAAARRARTDEEWRALDIEHGVLQEALELFGENDAPEKSQRIIQRRKDLIKFLVNLPDDLHKELLQKGYLKWQFASLDRPRQQAVNSILLMNRSTPPDRNDREDTDRTFLPMLLTADVGFAVRYYPRGQGQAVTLYVLSRDQTAPIHVPVIRTGVAAYRRDEAIRQQHDRFMVEQLTDLKDKPYSDLPDFASRPVPSQVALQTRGRFYVRAIDGEELTAEATEIGPTERLIAEWLDPQQSQVRLKTLGGNYLHVLGGGGGAVRADRRQPASSEVFDVEWVDRSARRVRLRTRNGFYLHAIAFGGSGVDAAVKEPGSSEVFVLVPLGGSSGETATAAVRAETRQKLEALIEAARRATTDEQWEAVLTEHVPLWSLAETHGEETEQFGEAEMAQMRDGGLALTKLLAGLPDEVDKDLLQSGYLKWPFAELDEPRRAALRDALTSVLSASGKMGFPAGLTERVPEMLASGDVGFAIIDVPEGQGLVWYFLMPAAPIPMMFPILGASGDNEGDVFSKSVYKQLSELEDKPYSDLMPLLKPADMERLQGVWRFVRGEANGEPATPRTLEIAANVWLMKDPQTGRTIERMTFDIDPAQQPKHITVTNSAIPRPIPAIYRFVNDELHITAASAPGGERPSDFNETGEGRFFVIMRRKPPPDVTRMNMEVALKQQQQEHDLSREIPFAVWETDGKAVLRFADWLLVFEGIDVAPGLKGLSTFRVPHERYDDSKRTGGGVSFSTNSSLLKLSIDDRIVDGISTISVNDVSFRMQGRAETLTFDESTYAAMDDVQQIVIHADGTTQLRPDDLSPGQQSSTNVPEEAGSFTDKIPEVVLQAFEQGTAPSGPAAFLMWDAGGKLGLLSEHWCLIFEGVAYERKATFGIGEGGGFARPDQIVSTSEPFETTYSSGVDELSPQIRITQSIADGVSDVNVAGYRFQLEGAAEKLTFRDATYTASDARQTIVIRGNGTTRLAGTGLGERGDLSPPITPDHHALQSPDDVLDQYTGTWKVELTEHPTAQSARKVVSRHTVQTEWILGDRTLQSYMTDETADEQWLIVRAFDDVRQMYRTFLFGSSGIAFERTGQWNDQDQTMRYNIVPPA